MATPRPRRKPGRPVGGRSGETREALIRATRELLAEVGLPRVTLRAVADRAGVGPALLNYYFGNKQELLREVVRGLAGELRARVAEEGARPGRPAERLDRVLHAVADTFRQHPYGPRLVFEQVLFADDRAVEEFVLEYVRPNLAVMSDILEEGRRTGELREVDPMFVIPEVFGTNAFFFLVAPVLGRLFDFEGLSDEIVERFTKSSREVIFHGVLAHPEKA